MDCLESAEEKGDNFSQADHWGHHWVIGVRSSSIDSHWLSNMLYTKLNSH